MPLRAMTQITLDKVQYFRSLAVGSGLYLFFWFFTIRRGGGSNRWGL